MAKWKCLIVTLSFLIAFTAGTQAQELPDCDPLNISIQLTDALNQAQRDMAQSKDLIAIFDQLDQAIQTLRETCAGGGESTTEAQPEAPSTLSFSGDADTVIGPVDIPAGTYRATATTDGYLIVHITAISGECGAGTSRLSEGLFSLSKDDATNGAEAIFTSRDCSALMEVSLVSVPWTLEFEKVG